jgi:exopolyphosphatase / guanosine-5'-triphosphate,3'-diphosphate pyrophosphatase
MRLAAIDIGTNSVHMIVVRVRPDFSFEVIDREKEMVRLGAGGLDGKKLTQEAMSSALQALSKFERLAKSHQVDEILAAATSATREAENGGEFLKAIERTTGVRPRIITGSLEAKLIHQAAVYGVDTPKPAVVIDIGGGSVEITLGTREEVRFARSFKIGVIRLTERFVKSDPLSGGDERKLVRHISEQVDRYVKHVVDAGFDQVIGTSGTILSVGTVAAALETGNVPAGQRNLRVSAKSIHRLRKAVTEQDLEERLKLPGLDPRRADLTVAGAVLVDTLLKKLGADGITLCDLALREGLVLEYIHEHRKEIARVDRYPDIRRRSTIELAERCSWEADHSRQVARLALSLFDQTRDAHRLGDKEREWLEFGALLHDIGMHISYERHHRHSYYLVKNGDLRGFEPDEIEVIALLTRYHRRAVPARSHEGFRGLPRPLRNTVRVLGAFLRIAESLDRSRYGIVKSIDIRTRGRKRTIHIYAIGDSELEVWAATRQLAIVAEAIGCDLELVAHHIAEPDVEAGTRRARRVAKPEPARRLRGKSPRAESGATLH